MRTIGFAFAGLTLTFFAAGNASAQKDAKKGGEKSFAKLDTNKDGKLSSDEFAKYGPPEKVGTTSKLFDKADANKDGYLSEAEFKKVPDIAAKKKKA